MLDVYIYDDDEAFTKRCSEQILKQASEMNKAGGNPVRIIINLSDPDQVLEACEKMEGTGLFFLNVESKSGVGGMELSQRIRKIEPNCYIVFIADSAEFAAGALKARVEPLGYVIKTSRDPERKVSEYVKVVVEKEEGCTRRRQRWIDV